MIVVMFRLMKKLVNGELGLLVVGGIVGGRGGVMDVGVVVDIGFLVLGDDGWLGCRLYLVGFVLIVLDI